MTVLAFRWQGDKLQVLDQRQLPQSLRYLTCRTADDVAQAIKTMAVRGAPAIGCCAAYGMVLATKKSRSTVVDVKRAADVLKSARPTAVNLSWAVDRMLRLFHRRASISKNIFDEMLREAKTIERQDLECNRAIGRFGSKLFSSNSTVLTHCNAGSLATAGYGTALGVVRKLFSDRKLKKVFIDETRPYLQGARLTAWEMAQEKIPHDLITDSMAAHFMKEEKISAVVVGCDRVAANGDTANKIGTYGVAVMARHHRIPFYVAMPSATLDVKIRSGKQIPIEERSSDEVVNIAGTAIAPKKTTARHPAFDVTPAALVTAFITEHGVVRRPFGKNLKKLAAQTDNLNLKN